MRWMRKARLRLRSLVARAAVEDDLTDELQDYLEREIEQQVAAGASPAKARRLAMTALNGSERVKEECRDARGVRWLEETLGDLRFAFRTLRRAPAFTATVVAAMAFGIGVNTAIFSIVDGVLFRPLPFADQDRLVSLTEGVPAAGYPAMPVSCPDYLFMAAENRSFEATAAFQTRSYEVSGIDQPRRVKGARVTASLFDVLKIRPLLGRAFTREEDDASKQVAVLDYGFARSVFGAPERALGRTIQFERRPYTVIGVMAPSVAFPPRGLRFNDGPIDLYIPISFTKDEREVDNYNYSMIARLRPGATLAQASAEATLLVRRIVEKFPPDLLKVLRERMRDFRLTAQVAPLREEVAGGVRRPLLLLLAAAGLLLLIGCADIANLMFSRIVARGKEFALRLALGAGNWRLARQTLVEGLVLSAAGGAIGFAAAAWVLPALLRFAPEDLPRLDEIGVNWRIAVFAGAVTLATPLLFSFAPLMNTMRAAARRQLQGRAETPGRRQRLTMSLAVVVQFSLAFVLLTTAGLLLRSFFKAMESDPGFRPEQTISVRLALPDSVYGERGRASRFFDGLLASLSGLPGLQQAGALSDLPMQSTSNRLVSAEGSAAGAVRVECLFSAGNALDALRIRLVRGRFLQPGDERDVPDRAVISESLARRLWPRQDAIGRRLRFGLDDKEPLLRVVGVVNDVRDRLTSSAPRFALFTTREDWVREMNVLVRFSGDPRSVVARIRQEVARLDRSLPVGRIETLDQVLDQSLSAERFRTFLLGAFAFAALCLAMLGIAGLLAYDTAQRTREYGVRVALGAERRDLLLMVVRRCLRLSGTGIAIGLAASLLLTRTLSGFLYGTSPHDLGTLAGVCSALVLVALGAALVPALRVVRTDPATSLRAE